MRKLSYIIALYAIAVASLSFSLPCVEVFIQNKEIKVVSKDSEVDSVLKDTTRTVIRLNSIDQEKCMNLPAGKYELYQDNNSSRLLFNFEDPVVICKQGKFYNIFYAKNFVLFMSIMVH